MTEPLQGVRVLTLGGIGPVPFAAMTLADMGAHVLRIERPGAVPPVPHDILYRGTELKELDLKDEAHLEHVREEIAAVDIVLEGFRPGVAERLGLGPQDAQRINPAIVYGRMTGWGQEGPLAQVAGHDINYIALSGALEPIVGADGAPVPPINFLGDFGGGAMYLVSGVLAGLVSARATGKGTVVDAAIVDGAAHMTAMLHSARKVGQWGPRGSNILDSGAPFYRVYRTLDGKWMAVGAIEPKFYGLLVEILGVGEMVDVDKQYVQELWPETTKVFAKIFGTRTRRQWEQAFDGTDACVSPVLAPDEVVGNEHLRARGTYVSERGYVEPAPAPRFRDLG